jgi:DNA-binding transcriptional LysR family regulator
MAVFFAAKSGVTRVSSMVPTPRAEQLAQELHQVLDAVESLMATDLSEVRFHSGSDSALLEYQRQLVPIFETDNQQTAIQMVRNSDFLFPSPPIFMKQFDAAREVIALPMPGAHEISIKYVMVRHQRVESSPPHDFLYGEILATTELFRSRMGLPTLPELRKRRSLDY